MCYWVCLCVCVGVRSSKKMEEVVIGESILSLF